MNNKEQKILIKIAVIIFLFVLISQTIVFLLPNPNEIGDAFGVANSLFSASAFGLLIYSSWMQRQELEWQRQELQDTRAEFKTQNDTLKRQRFENTLFSMISLHHEIVNNLKTEGLQGRAIFESAADYLVRVVEQSEVEGPSDPVEIFWHKITIGYQTFDSDYNRIFSHYFRNLYNLLKFIYLSDLIRDDEKETYVNIVKAQLSLSELTLIFFNGLVSKYGYPNLLYLIKHFQILEDFRSKQLGENEKIYLKVYEKALEEVVPSGSSKLNTHIIRDN